jgi:hypothetical protein
MTYRHRQFSLYAVGSFVAATALMGFAFFFPAYPRIETGMVVVFLCMAAFLAVLHFFVAFLTVEVSPQELTWCFGGGFWRNRMKREDITGVTRVRLPWWYGLGVKYDRPAWVYLVAPGAGVEVVARNGDIVRVGTDDPDGLMAALRGPG